MKEFKILYPDITDPIMIEELSLECINNKARTYEQYKLLSEPERKVVNRLIHSTSIFDQIINNIYFTKEAIKKLKELLISEAIIITDTNMIKTGLNNTLTEKYNNEVICYVSDQEVMELAKKENTTRTIIAVQKALDEFKNNKIILACGNAPTFLYAAIEYLVLQKIDLDNIALIGMPVGFINVEESKNYTLEFLKQFHMEGIVLKSNYGGSPLVVSCLHAIYKLL